MVIIRSGDTARAYTAKHLPVIQQYVDCLAEVLEPRHGLTLMNEIDCSLITVSQTRAYGFRQNGYVCDQTWTLGMAGSEKIALIAE
jgi:hypothetical protein